MNFAIIGCGRVAPRHAQSIEELDDAKLIAVTDIVVSRAKHMAERYAAKAFTDYHEMLGSSEIDVVNVCTPSGMHAQMAIDVMESGKHVIVEKPMALTLADADRMIAVSKATGRKLCIILQNRFNPPMQDLRRVIDEGRLGRCLLGNATVRWYRPQEYYEDGWHGTLAMDGGALMNQSIHHIDALQWLMGDVEEVHAYTGTLVHDMEAEDTGVVAMKFNNGALGIVEGSTITYPHNLEGSVAIFGEKGSVKVGGTALNRKVLWKIEGELEHERELITRDQVDPPSVYGYSHKKVIADMIQAIQQQREPQTNGIEGRKSVALVLAMYESSRTGFPVNLNQGVWNGQYTY